MVKANKNFSVAVVVFCFPVILILLLLVVHFFQTPPTRGVQPNACINNLRMIDAAKEQWAWEHNSKSGDSINEADLMTYFKKDSSGNPIKLKCPQGGAYILGKIGQNPICSFHGDLIGTNSSRNLPY
jgi:heme/copper-type cytochrome/quinol oxidase subunit 2